MIRIVKKPEPTDDERVRTFLHENVEAATLQAQGLAGGGKDLPGWHAVKRKAIGVAEGIYEAWVASGRHEDPESVTKRMAEAIAEAFKPR